VIAKPAEQTPLIAALAVRLCHEAGIPNDVLQLAPVTAKVGAALTSDPRIAGVAFTGSTETARAINRALAARDAPIGVLVAENRRAERAGRRQLGAARAGRARRDELGFQSAGSAAARCACSTCRTMSPTACWR
jgi:hypothetical protein